jgi:hypothetical protein
MQAVGALCGSEPGRSTGRCRSRTP